jgi:hypothetical protein
MRIASIPLGRDADTAQRSHTHTHEGQDGPHTKAPSAATGQGKGDGECKDDKEYNGVWNMPRACAAETYVQSLHAESIAYCCQRKVVTGIYGRFLSHVRSVRRPG